MINASSAFEELMMNGLAKYLPFIDITLTDNTLLHLTAADIWSGSLSIEDAVSSDSDFQVGAAIMNKAHFSINNIYGTYSQYDFNGAKAVIYIGLYTSPNTLERLRKGTYIIDEADYNGSIIDIECLDYMSKFDRPYSRSMLTYPATMTEVVREACTRCSVQLNTYNFPHYNYSVNAPDEKEATTFREVISWCAQIAGCFARCNADGQLELKWYDETALNNAVISARGGIMSGYADAHSILHTFGHNISVDDVVITGVRITVKKETTASDPAQAYTAQTGTDGYVVAFSGNPFITTGNVQTILGWLGTQLIGFTFRKAKLTHVLNPTMEAGDVAIVWDRKNAYFPIVVSKTVFNLSNQQETVSAAQTPARNSATRFLAETRNYVELRRRLQAEHTARENALESLRDDLNSSSGLYCTIDSSSGEGNIYYLHNKARLDQSNVVWKMTAEAWGVTTNYNREHPEQTQWNAGMTVDGDTVVRLLAAEGVSASWIDAGELKIENLSGHETFYANCGDQTSQSPVGTVRICGDVIQVNGSTKTLTMQAFAPATTQGGNPTEVFYLNSATGVVRINASSFSISGQSIATIAGNAGASAADAAISDYEPVDHMTRQEIFNKLTNNGTNSGLYLENGGLYINFNYAKGGELQLGSSTAQATDDPSLNDLGVLKVCNGTRTTFAMYYYGLYNYYPSGRKAIGIGAVNSSQYPDIIFYRDTDNVNRNRIFNVRYMTSASVGDQIELYTNFADLLIFTDGSGTDIIIDAADEVLVYTSDGDIKFKPQFTTSLSSKTAKVIVESDLRLYGDILTGGSVSIRNSTDTANASLTCGYLHCEHIVCSDPPWPVETLSESDERLKKNIENADSQTRNINQLKIRQFDWKESDLHVNAGVVAQELREVYPELVKEKSDGYLAVDYVSMVPYLVKVIQEQQEEIQRLSEVVFGGNRTDSK